MCFSGGHRWERRRFIVIARPVIPSFTTHRFLFVCFFFCDAFHSPLAYFHFVSYGRFQSEASSTKFHRVREGKEERERAREIHRVHYKFRMVSRGRIVYSMFVFLLFSWIRFRFVIFLLFFLFVHAFPCSLKIDLSIMGERADERQTGCVEKEVAVSQRGG